MGSHYREYKTSKDQPIFPLLENTILIWKVVRPGGITGASDDNPSGIATYSQAGAKFGLGLLWMAYFTFTQDLNRQCVLLNHNCLLQPLYIYSSI